MAIEQAEDSCGLMQNEGIIQPTDVVDGKLTGCGLMQNEGIIQHHI